METIHLKTVDPISQDLLRAAEQKGIRLNWERYEKLQPQDGFLRLGLSCPYGCLQGPCRIDPFGRGPDRGLCGLDRDGMVAAFSLRLALQGVLEIADGSQPENDLSGSRLTKASYEKTGGTPVSTEDIYKSAGMLARPAEPVEKIIRQILRMGLLAVELASSKNESAHRLSCRAGYGLMADTPIVVGVMGRVTPEVVASLCQSAGQQTDAVYRVLSLGDWIPLDDRYLPIACTSGEAELLLSTGHIAALLFGTGTDSGLLETGRALNVPMIDASKTTDPDEVLKTAKTYQNRHQRVDFKPDSSLVNDGHALGTVDALKEGLDQADDDPWSIIGGADMPYHPHGRMPMALAQALTGSGTRVAAWGDAAVWMIKDGLCSPGLDRPALVLDPQTGVVRIVEALQQLDKLDRLSGISFTGMKGCCDFAMAMGLAAAGLQVAVASPIPVWGSEKTRQLFTEQLAACGGELVHFDHPAQTEEILDWFKQ